MAAVVDVVGDAVAVDATGIVTVADAVFVQLWLKGVAHLGQMSYRYIIYRS